MESEKPKVKMVFLKTLSGVSKLTLDPSSVWKIGDGDLTFGKSQTDEKLSLDKTELLEDKHCMINKLNQIACYSSLKVNGVGFYLEKGVKALLTYGNVIKVGPDIAMVVTEVKEEAVGEKIVVPEGWVAVAPEGTATVNTSTVSTNDPPYLEVQFVNIANVPTSTASELIKKGVKMTVTKSQAEKGEVPKILKKSLKSLKSGKVSTKHGEIGYDKDHKHFYYSDIGSTNGSMFLLQQIQQLFNDSQSSEWIDLKPGLKPVIAGHVFEIQLQ